MKGLVEEMIKSTKIVGFFLVIAVEEPVLFVVEDDICQRHKSCWVVHRLLRSDTSTVGQC